MGWNEIARSILNFMHVQEILRNISFIFIKSSEPFMSYVGKYWSGIKRHVYVIYEWSLIDVWQKSRENAYA